MARRKKPEGLTPEEQIIHSVKEAIANNANRSEKTSWNRKMDNMVKLIISFVFGEIEINS